MSDKTLALQIKNLKNEIQVMKSDFSSKFVQKYMGLKGTRFPDATARNLSRRSMMGLPADTCYWDPTGSVVDGGVNLIGQPGGLRDQIAPAMKEFNRCVEMGYPPEEAVWSYRRAARKTLLASAWNIPIYAVRGTPIVSRGALPAMKLLPRITTDRGQVQTTPLTSIGTSTVIAPGDNNYTYTDDTYHGGTIGHYTFDVKGWGRGNKIDELMSLIGNVINNPRMSTSEAQLLSAQRYAEIQVIQGTHVGVGFSGDASGFKGIYDWRGYADFGYLLNMGGAALTGVQEVREGIDTLEANGADRDSLIGMTDSVTLTKIKNDLQHLVRTQNPAKTYVFQDPLNNINIKIQGVDVDGVKVFPSYGSPTTAGKREINFMDLHDHALFMVQDATLKPLAKIGPHEDMATDMFGVLGSSGVGHCGTIHTIA